MSYEISMRKICEECGHSESAMSDEPCILVVGNPTEGFRFFGPFKNFEEACSFSEGIDADSWVSTLEKGE